MVLVVWGQDVATEDTLAVAKDSVSIGSHTESLQLNCQMIM